ncbi:hypothetical protein NDI76_16065 [Halogeometricum sp. S1BR25-6]|uniref:DUF4129 domain-containing protein n=1 Tax=Halogeometricum salsisoli TaxID=2950536 RepID=A0ABU2GHI7_9EURY|nr:hypothetical protein [Halogeometricum sp. S1BR25-6]MDS0300262.1 hypothetical protein [Halogeometricum sp. S1BR25-6]
MNVPVARSVRTTLIVLALVLAVAAAPPVVAASDAGSAGIERGGTDIRAQQTTPTTATNNTSVRHANPDEADAENTEDALRAQLTARLADRLEGSSVQLSEEQYDRAKQLLGDEYVDTLGKYADVADESGEEETAQNFEQAGETQRNLSDSLAEYRETEEAYQAAKSNGNEEEARRLARELVRIGEDVDRQSTELDETYAELGNQTDVDFSDAQERIRTVQQDMANSTAQVRAAELRATTLTVEADDETASFVDPLQIEGRLVTADESPVADRTITLRVGERSYAVETDDEGAFELDYRPAGIPVNTSQVTVRYLPQTTSVYIGSNASVPIAVEQVNGTVEFQSVPEEVSFGDSVAVAGRVAVDGRPVSNLSVDATLGERSVGGNVTGADGRFATNGTVSAGVPSGDQRVRVTSGTDSAVVVDAAQPVTVTATPTNLTLTLTPDDGTVVASGRLTADGTGVADRQVALSVDGDVVTGTRTGDDGRYQIRFDRRLLNEDTTVSVQFDGSGTNLESATAVATRGSDAAGGAGNPVFGVGGVEGSLPGIVGVGGSGSGDGSGGSLVAPVAGQDGPSPEGIAFGAAATVLILAAGWYAVRRWLVSDGSGSVDEIETGDTGEDESVEPIPSPVQLLAQGKMQGALLAAYQTVQRALAPSLDESPKTHRQFYQACQRTGAVPMDALRQLNDAYERAVYSDRELSLDEARDAIMAAERIVSNRGRGGDQND